MQYVPVLDHGFVKLIDSMGSDHTVSQSARMSFGKETIGLTKADIELIKGLAAKNHCYDALTEVFTDRGWVLWPDLTGSEKLAAVIGNTFKFEKPESIYIGDYEGDMISISSDHISLLVTPEHRMLIKKKKKDGYSEPVIVKAESLPKGFRLQSSATVDTKDGDERDYFEGFLYGFFLGDGYRKNQDTIQFHLKKPRKIDSILLCLQEIDKYIYKCRVSKDGSTTITVNIKDRKMYGKGFEKKVDESSFFESKKYMRGLWDGLMESDGSRKRSSMAFSTTSALLRDSVIRLGTMLGFYVKECSGVSEHGNRRHVYRLMTLNRSCNPRMDSGTRGKGVERVGYSGKVYCATVSTGLLLVRRLGRQCVCGNSTPFRHPHVLLHIKFPVFVARQLMRHNVGVTWSEKSMRYTDASNTAFYIPNKERLDGEALTVIWEANLSAMRHYRELLELDTPKELARTVLPVSVYTEVYMTASLQALTHLIKLRDDRHAQIETQEYARAIKKIVTELFPVSVNALLGSE